jgi:hypothetical protein
MSDRPFDMIHQEHETDESYAYELCDALEEITHGKRPKKTKYSGPYASGVF